MTCKHCIHWRLWSSNLRWGQCWEPDSPQNLEKQSVPVLTRSTETCGQWQDRLVNRREFEQARAKV